MRIKLITLQTIKDTFHIFDENKDGKITREELRAVFLKTGTDPTEEELDKWFKDFDENGKMLS